MTETFKVDLTNCDREPIHIPGSVQPHGAMLVCDAQGVSITHHSANAQEFLGLDYPSLAGMPLVDVLGEKLAHDLKNAAAKGGGSEVAGVVLGISIAGSDGPVDAMIHRHKNRMFVELERSDVETGRAHEALDLTQALIRRIGLETEVKDIASTAAKLIRAMLGYDRVMVYRFLHNGAGRVIAEAKASRLNSFLGQHFPASDIPFQARRLYLQNSIRMIADSSYDPVPVVPGIAISEDPIDMSFAHLRSVSPIHCEYLRNMGVAGTMSVSIIVDGELWGLVACHHDSPRIIPLPLRIGAELFGQYLSLQIAVAERRADYLASSQARERLDRIVSALDPQESVSAQLRGHLRELAELVPTSGAGLWIENEWSTTGTAVTGEHVGALMELVREGAGNNIWSTDELRLHFPHLGSDSDAIAGLLAIPISAAPRDYLVLFRGGEAHQIEWAGEPKKQVVSSPFGDRLTPRGSFETWREDVRGRSQPWTEADVAVAEAIRTYLRDVVLRYNEITADARARAEQRRRVLNEELNHRVKNIIALVKSIALQTGAHATSVADYSSSLEGRLRALALAHDQSLDGAGGDLTALIEAEAGLHRYGAFPDRVTVDGPRLGLDDRTFGVLALVVHEMMTNAAKYGALSVPEGQLAVRWRLDDDGDCEILWEERDGPTVAEPSRSGFGSKLIATTIAYDLGGTANVSYEPAGVRARFVIPAQYIREAASSRIIEVPTPPIQPLAGLNVLLVEDQSLIALDMEDVLRELGAASVRAVPNVREARMAIDDAAPDCAILDFNLGDENSEVIADALFERGIPFVFATGYGDSVMLPERHHKIPVLRKPAGAAVLAGLLAEALAGAPSSARSERGMRDPGGAGEQIGHA